MTTNKITVAVKLQIGERVMTISDAGPIHLSGDRRRWRKQIADHIATVAESCSTRFDPAALQAALDDASCVNGSLPPIKSA